MSGESVATGERQTCPEPGMRIHAWHLSRDLKRCSGDLVGPRGVRVGRGTLRAA